MDNDPDLSEVARQAQRVEGEQCSAAEQSAETGDLEARGEPRPPERDSRASRGRPRRRPRGRPGRRRAAHGSAWLIDSGGKWIAALLVGSGLAGAALTSVF